MHSLVAIVTLLALLLYFFMGLRVGQARGLYKVEAPATSGHPDFERVFRVHANTLEWLPIFLPALWLFAIAWNNDLVAAGVGVVWIVGRVLYMTGYSKAAASRSTGFGIQALATGVLLFGALGKIIWMAVQNGI
ncbi:MAG: MAPEG family protein [Proteobacteria bacterium]|nr:MAPEG family protein [Pseudomonadota bacterium]